MNHKTYNFHLRLIIPAILCLFLISGCYINFSAYGGYQGSLQAGRMFESPQPGYTYYYAHTHSDPQALVGISPAYTLDNDLWTRVNPADLKRLLDNMTIRADYQLPIFSSYIKDPHGNIIGIYYSRWIGGPVEMLSGNRVNVNLPNVRERRDDGDARSAPSPIWH